MKRMLLRLSALTAVISLGTFAVVEAQRSSRTAQAEPTPPAQVAVESVAGEPAPFIVDERTVKPMPQPSRTEAPADRYASRDAADATPAAAVDPFSAGQWDAKTPLVAEEEAVPAVEDSQSIPSAADAMRRYENDRAGAQRNNIRPLAYDDPAVAAQSPDDQAPAEIAPAAERQEPTLAPPREGRRAVPPPTAEDATAPAEKFAESPQPELAEPAPREIPPPSDRYRRTATTANRPQEPALLPDESLDEKPNLAEPDTANFAPPAERARTAGAASEGQGRPGGRHLEGPQAPHLTIEKIAPADVQVGKPAVFTLKVRNTGAVPATHVEIHDSVPKGTQLLSTTPRASEQPSGEVVWSLNTVKPGEETSVQIEVMPVAEGEIGSVATVHFAAESSVRTTVTKPVLALDLQAPREILLGEELTMAITLSNTGSGAATGVVLREVVPENLQHPAGPELEYEVGVLRPGEKRSLNLSMRAAKAGRVVNTLAALGDGNLRVDQQADIEVIAPALAVKMDGPARRYLDRQATYTVTVSNPGTATAKEISLVTHLPPGLKFVEANNAGQYDARTRSVQWLLEELPPKEAGSVTLTTVPVEVGEQIVRIESSAQRGLAAQEEKSIVVEGVAAINFEVVDLADPVEVGGETGYEIRVVNQGTKAATNVQVVVLFPEELKPLSAEGPARYTVDGQRVLFDSLGQLAPKADTTYRVKAEGRGPGDVRVHVQIMTDEIRTPVTKEESTRVYADEQ